jgi:hypothetical protein
MIRMDVSSLPDGKKKCSTEKNCLLCFDSSCFTRKLVEESKYENAGRIKKEEDERDIRGRKADVLQR